MATYAGVPVGFSGARDRDADNPLTPGYGLSTKKHETAACRIADTFLAGLATSSTTMTTKTRLPHVFDSS